MKFNLNIVSALFGLSILFVGCSQKVEEYNKPAMYWYGKIIKSVANADLEKADSYYTSLQGEHIASPLLPEATMILAIAHLHYEEYLLSEHFLDQYNKRYATDNEKEFADFLKIKAMYKALPNPRRDQALIANTISAAIKFKQEYPSSMYIGIVDTMITRLQIAKAVLDETIASLYDRLDKPESAKYYRNITPHSWIEFDHIQRANSPWYRSWFEGDGTQSWYKFMIPDTKSVVSRHRFDEPSKKETSPSWYKSWYNDLLGEDKPDMLKKQDTKNNKIDNVEDEHSSEQLPLD